MADVKISQLTALAGAGAYVPGIDTTPTTWKIPVGNVAWGVPQLDGSGNFTYPANLVSDLALKAPLASPAFTGTPTAPTAAAGTSTTQLATTAFAQALKGASVFPVENYGAVGDGTTDDFTAIQNCINAAIVTGGIITFQAKTYRINSQLTFPNDAATPPNQKSLVFQGVAPWMSGEGGSINGGTVLDLRSSNALGKIATYGLGYLEFAGITFTDNGTNSNPFLYTTNTTLHVHDCGFIGNPSKTGVTCDQDAIVLGGTTHNLDGSTTAAFQGYGTVIRDNYFNKCRRACYGQVDFNGCNIVFNTIWNGCGTNLANGAAIELDGLGIVANTANYIAGNLIEVTSYIYGIKVTNGNFNVLDSNLGFDAGGSTLAMVRIESTSQSNVVYGTQPPGGSSHYLSDAGTATRYISTESNQYTLLGPISMRDEGSASLFPRITFTGGANRTLIQPAATATGGAAMLQVLRSAAEGTNPNGVTFEVDYNSNVTFGDGSGSLGATITNFGRTWTAGNGGSGGNMIINSGTGGSGLRLQNNNTTIESNTGTLQIKFGSNLGWGNSAEQIAFGASSDAILTRIGADTIGMNRSTNPQSFFVSNTYTSTTNYERGGLTWSGNVLQLVTQNGSSGTLREISLVPNSIVTCTGDFDVNTAGKGLRVAEGSNAKQGTATLVNGTVTVSNTSVTANSRIFLSGGALNASTAIGVLSVPTQTAATSFVITSYVPGGTSTQTGDLRTVNYEIFEPG